MPELPEVETIVRRLDEAIPGRRVERAEILRANVVRGTPGRFARAIEGRTIERVRRRAKFIAAELDDGRVWVTHLRMSGRYLVVPGSRRNGCSRERARGSRGEVSDAADLPAYTRAVFTLDDGSRLLYIDARTLGGMELLSASEWEDRSAALGPEPLEPGFTPELLLERLATSRQPVKPFLLDQTRIAGIGNIYAVEALWRARVSPRRRARNVGPVRARRLRRAIVDVLEEALGRSGTSLGATYLDYADGDGEPGSFYELLNVYDREGLPCPRCGTAIRRIVQAQRSTYYCPECQR
ncbi:MAG: bifunctional DNA-formamidopyrimidine glycosylase/DNA-(apurinic or apyrimidinic site) lyase [Gemmatimonadota bacterium]